MNALTHPLRLKLRTRYILAAIAAVLYFTGFVGFDQWYLSWFCLVPLFFALDGASPKRGLFIGWFFGFVALTGGFYWVAYTIHVFASLPWFASVIGCLLLSIGQGTQFALFGLLYTWLMKKTHFSPLILGTTIFVATEFVSPQLFPHYFANSQYRLIPLIQISDITGVLGLTALLVFVNTCIYIIIKSFVSERRFRWGLAVSALAVVALVVAYGYLRLPSIETKMERAPKIRFGIAQANLGIREKSNNPKKAIRLNQKQTAELKEMGADIVVWPETAVQGPSLLPGMKKLPYGIFNDLDIPVLLGAYERGDGSSKPPLYNIAVLTNKDGEILDIYKKQKLLMFGEYLPFAESYPKIYDYFPFITRMIPGKSNKPFKFRDYLLNINICYEEILPRLMHRMMSYSPHVLVNLTNDNWFGRTHEPLQHLVLALFRSVEHRRWLVRSTNTGISAFVDATGKIVKQSPLMEPAMLIYDVPMMSGKTVYGYLGDWFGWLSIAAVLILIISIPWRKKVRS